MVRKELTVMARYPIEFISSFGRVFLIVAIFTLGAQTFSSHQGGQIQEIGAGSSNTAGLVVYGFILFMFLSDTLWTIGYNIRNEQLQGTLEQLYLSPASKFAMVWAASLIRKVKAANANPTPKVPDRAITSK